MNDLGKMRTKEPHVYAIGDVIGGLWLVVVLVVMSAMSGIYRTALYRFTVDGKAPPAFEGVELGDAFAPREERRGLFG